MNALVVAPLDANAMPRKPTQIPGLSDVQVQAYYKSFLHALDESDHDLTDFEESFTESNLTRTREFSPAQISVIENMMDKFPKVRPRFKDYNKPDDARRFFLGESSRENFFEKEG